MSSGNNDTPVERRCRQEKSDKIHHFQTTVYTQCCILLFMLLDFNENRLWPVLQFCTLLFIDSIFIHTRAIVTNKQL